MTRFTLVFLAACGGSQSSPATSPAQPEATAEPEPLSSVDPAASALHASPNTDPALDNDIQQVTGGNFVVDHIGPDAIEATEARIANHPGAYLERFEATHFVREGDHIAPIPVHVRSPMLLARLYPHLPERVREVARRHAWLDERFLHLGQLDDGARRRVESRRRALTLLAGGIDTLLGDNWEPFAPAEWCLGSLPAIGRVLRLARDCTCGETTGCSAALQNGTLVVDARFDPNAMGICDDCYSTFAGCRLPELPPDQDVVISVNGTSVGTLEVAWNGVPIRAPFCAD